jgi:hypothetical protein
MLKNRIFFRRIPGVTYVEYFLVSAISSILLIRLFLELTGYPQLGGDNLHIAHMLWGGLLMLISILLLLSFMGRAIENLSAILGGLGFGTFIDEIGKFLTKDNDYFFKPSIAIIYFIFILIFLIMRAIQRKSEYSSQEYLLNALRELEELAINDLDVEGKNRALDYLEKSGHNLSLTESMKKVLSESEHAVSAPGNVYQRVKAKIRAFYGRVSELPIFKYGIIVFFVIQFISQLIFIFTLVFISDLAGDKYFSLQIIHNILEKFHQVSFVEVAELSSVFISGIFISLGIWHLPKSRVKAFRMFERSILISIFVTQVFVFYEEQFGALVGLIFNLIILAGIKYMIRREPKPA